MTKLISIIVPCYNQAQFLSQTLESVLEQTYPHWECIIVNDGSPDNTEEIAKEYCNKDDRFKYIKKENGGLASARNVGIDACKGDYIQFLDSDDLIHPRKFEWQMMEFSDDNIKIAISSNQIFRKDKSDASDNLWITHTIGNLKEDVILKWDDNFAIPIHAALFSADFFSKNKIRFCENLGAKEDWLFWIECTQINDSYIYDDRVMAYYRQHENSMTKNEDLMFHNTITAAFLIVEKIADPVLKRQFVDKIEKTIMVPILLQRNVSESQVKGKKKYKFLYNVLLITNIILIIGIIILCILR